MNLTNLFNFKYLKENMKKSKAIIFLCIFLIPVINVIIYLMKAVNRNIFVPSIYDVSMLSLFGMYVIPVILSIALFSFVYKRRSSDFVMSFPVTKKQIFLSNTLGGIAVIGIMNIVNLVLELIASILLSNVMINYGMLFEMALVWSIGYTFVFVCTNIAVSISANKITTVAVTLLVLFLIPFIHTFINTMAFELGNDSIVKTVCEEEGCKPLNYDCFGDKYCLDSVKKGEYPGSGYTRIYENNYTLPYSFISSAIFIMEDSNISKILLKTFFISIIYVFIGLLLFERKKFEVVETSFKSERMHIFIRSLTLVPFICIYYVLLRELSITIEDLFTVIFMFVLIFTYIIIYDLITRKKIINIFKSLASVIIVGIIITFVGEISINNKVESLNVKDIDKMTIMDGYENFISKGYTYDKRIINYVMGINIENVKESNPSEFISFRIDTKKGSYKFQINVDDKRLDNIMNMLSKDDTYIKSSKALNSSRVFGFTLDNDTICINKNDELYDVIINKIKDKKIINGSDNSIFNLKVYTYDDFVLNNVMIDVSFDKEIMEEIIDIYNQKVKEIKKISKYSAGSYLIGYSNQIESDYIEDRDNRIYNFIIDNLEEKVNVNEDYAYLDFSFYDINTGNGNKYIFVTNRVSELNSIISEIRKLEETDIQEDIDGDVS